MSISILGTGAMGRALATRLVATGHSVVLGSRNPSRARAVAGDIGGGVQSGSLRGAAQAADVIVLAVPFEAAHETLGEAGELGGKIVIDITNPLNADVSG